MNKSGGKFEQLQALCSHLNKSVFTRGIVIQTIVIQICCHTAHQCILVFFVFFLAFPLTTLDIFRYFAYNALLTLC